MIRNSINNEEALTWRRVCFECGNSRSSIPAVGRGLPGIATADGVEDPHIELFDARGESRLSMAIDSFASDDGGLVYINFEKGETPRLVLSMTGDEINIKEVDAETASEIRSVRLAADSGSRKGDSTMTAQWTKTAPLHTLGLTVKDLRILERTFYSDIGVKLGDAVEG